MKLKLGILGVVAGLACAGVGFNFFYDSGHSVSLSSQSGVVEDLGLSIMHDNEGGAIVYVRRDGEWTVLEEIQAGSKFKDDH